MTASAPTRNRPKRSPRGRPPARRPDSLPGRWACPRDPARPARPIRRFVDQCIMELASGTRASVAHGAFGHWKVSVTGEGHGQPAGRRARGNGAPARRCRLAVLWFLAVC